MCDYSNVKALTEMVCEVYLFQVPTKIVCCYSDVQVTSEMVCEDNHVQVPTEIVITKMTLSSPNSDCV